MKLSSLTEAQNSEEYRQELSENKFLELLKTKAKNSHLIATKSPLFCQDKGASLMLVTPKMHEERSSFWVDKLIKDIPAWKNMPSRSRFIKAYTQFDRTSQGDDVYVMIPFDGTRIGVASSTSFYRSFLDFKNVTGFDKVDNKSLANWLNIILKGLKEISNSDVYIIEPNTFIQFKQGLKNIDDILLSIDRTILRKNLRLNDTLDVIDRDIIKDLLTRHMTTSEKYLNEKLDPTNNGFYSSRIESFSDGTVDHEVWVDSPVLLIKRITYIDMNKRGLL